MKIIGINILGNTDEFHLRSLTPRWYPLVSADLNDADTPPHLPSIQQDIPDRFFTIDKEMPEVNISCIVGLNGAGKTSLIELILKVLYNFTAAAFSQADGHEEGEDELLGLSVIPGIFADLYLQIEKSVYCISVKGKEEVKLLEFDRNGRSKNLGLYDNEYEVSVDLVARLCFTVCINYGLHSFNSRLWNSFEANRHNQIHTRWFDRIFHLEDNYHIPIKILPRRNDGIIDINTENKLTKQRATAISLLLFHKGLNSVPNGYTPSYIRYEVVPQLEETVKKQYKQLVSTLPESDGDLLPLFDVMHDEWKEWVDKNIPLDGIEYDDIKSSSINYISLESLKIGISHYPYTEDIRSYIYQESLDYPDKANAREVCAKLISDILQDDSYVTVEVHAVIDFLLSDVYSDKWSGEIPVKRILEEGATLTYMDIVKRLPPKFVHYECYFSNGQKSDLSIDRMSSGERQFLFAFSAVLSNLAYLSSLPQNDTHRIQYSHVNFIFDEIELYFHPEFQRSLLKTLLDGIAALGLDKDVIKSINILLATHSPFVLSDIPAQNVLYLGKEGEGLPKTFGANIFDSLKDGFFMQGSMGCLVTDKIRELIRVYYENDEAKQKAYFIKHRAEFRFIAENVEDEYWKGVLNRFYEALENKFSFLQR